MYIIIIYTDILLCILYIYIYIFVYITYIYIYIYITVIGLMRKTIDPKITKY